MLLLMTIKKRRWGETYEGTTLLMNQIKYNIKCSQSDTHDAKIYY